MAQDYNLSELANKVNSSGRLDASTGLVNSTPVLNGGTGLSSLTANSVLLGNDTSSVQLVAPGTSGNVLMSNGTTWSSQALPAQRSLKAWETRSSGTNYTAATDGFFVVNTTNGGAVYGGFTIVVNGTEVVKSRSPSEGGSGWQTGTFPVRAGQTYRADLTGGGVSLISAFFIPLS